jgi:hypothetical protein
MFYFNMAFQIVVDVTIMVDVTILTTHVIKPSFGNVIFLYVLLSYEIPNHSSSCYYYDYTCNITYLLHCYISMFYFHMAFQIIVHVTIMTTHVTLPRQELDRRNML